MIRRAALLAVLIAAGSAAADPPNNSLRPILRGGNPVVQPVAVAPSGALRQPARDAASDRARDRGGLSKSLRPMFRSQKVERAAVEQRRQRQRGAVCGDLDIQGEEIGRVSGESDGCGIDEAVRVRSVSGITLSTGALMDCRTAGALKRWMELTAKPVMSGTGGGLKRVRVAAHYACRARNNQTGAKVSEHGRGRAIDISAFILQNGTEVSVLQGWNNRSHGAALRQVHRGACGPFGTVLGPDSDRFHRDHFHFDTARYRSGSYCR